MHIESPPDAVEKELSTTRTNTAEDDNLVDFDPDDPSNPLNWPMWQKWSIVLLVSLTLTVDTFATTIIIPAAPVILSEFHETSPLYIPLLVSIWELGEGIGPFVYAPLSEIFGRTPVYHAGNILLTIFLVASAVSTNMPMFVAFRFLSGFVTTTLTQGPSIVADLFAPEDRGTAMAVNVVMPLVGPLTAPLVGSFVTASLGWRWSIWIVAIAAGTLMLLSFAVFRETYAVTILARKAKQKREATGDDRWRSRHQDDVDKTTVVQSITRPARMLLLEPAVLLVSLYMAFSYGINYLISTSLVEIMESSYGWKESITGLAFLPNTIGAIIGMILYGLTSDRYLAHRAAKTGAATPEDRLPHLLLGAALLPPGMLFYAWTLQRTPWIAPLLGTAVVGVSLLLTWLSTENYLVDAFGLYGASAVAAGVALRALFGAFFPLLSPPVYGRLGLGWGNTLFGLLAAAFIPLLIFVWKYGAELRRHRWRWHVGRT